MKNKAAFFFVFIANMVLLVHAVIPHHHHTEALYTNTVECAHQDEHNHHVHLPVCHDSHQQDESTDCLIKNSIFIPGKSSDENEMLDENSTALALFFDVYNTNSQSFDDNLNDTFSIDVCFPLNSRLINSSRSLRAPPVC